MTDHVIPTVRWSERLGGASEPTLAGVAWFPGGPCLVVIEPTATLINNYDLRIENCFAGRFDSPRKCREALAEEMRRSYQQAQDRGSP